MDTCPCYKRNNDVYGYCLGTKWKQLCSCQGDQSKCNYYPEKRERAKKMTTLEMMNLAKDNGKTYLVNDMLYNIKFGFHDKSGKKWYGDAFDYLNDLFEINEWQEDNTIYMTKSEAEEKYGIKIVR